MTFNERDVVELYIASFNRAPDEGGLNYWMYESGVESLEEMAASFFVQYEVKKLYPNGLNDDEFITAIYQNVFNRLPDDGGRQYWIKELAADTPREKMILTVINGAQTEAEGGFPDQETLDNKTDVGVYFAESGAMLTVEQAYEVMEDVTGDDQTVTDAKAQIDVWSTDAQTIPLTPDIDNILGTDLDNTITALVAENTDDNTLNPEDVINGGGGDNTLAFTNEAATVTTTAISHMSNVAALDYTNSATGNQAVNLAGTTGVETISMDGSSTAKTTFDEVVNLVALELGGSGISTTIVNYTTAAVIGGDNTMSIVNNTEAKQTVNVQGIENINLTSGTLAGVTNEILLRDTDLNKIAVDGAGAMILRTEYAVDTAASIIDLSASTGNIEVRAGIVDTAGATITSGSGADTINLNSGDDVVAYTRADQSQAANIDVVIAFDTGSDKIDFSAIITGDTVAGITVDAALKLGESMDTTVVTDGQGKYYIDVNTDKHLDKDDMIIDMNGETLVFDDFILSA